MQSKGFGPQLWRYAWDGEDQLRRVTTPDGVIWAYSYAPFRRWIGKRCVKGSLPKSPQRVEYLWAGNLLCEERRVYADGHEQSVGCHYEQGSFRPLAQEVDGALQYILTDYLGTPKELLSEDGEVVWSAHHEVWSRPAQLWHFRAANDNVGYTDCLLRFQGQIEDPETGLYYNRFRYYDPQTGNYCSSNPIGLAGGLSSNGYASNPLKQIDPLGLSGATYTFYHGTIAPYANDIVANGINPAIVRSGRSSMDFGQGFYVTNDRAQAEAWANRLASRPENAGAVASVVQFDVPEEEFSKLSNTNINDGGSAWEAVVREGRSGTYQPGTDMTEGPMLVKAPRDRKTGQLVVPSKLEAKNVSGHQIALHSDNSMKIFSKAARDC